MSKSAVRRKAQKKQRVRNYRREYLQYHAKPGQVKKRALRNGARRAMLKAGRVKKGQDVDHKKALNSGGSNSLSNLRATSPSYNRGRNSKNGGRPKGGRKPLPKLGRKVKNRR